MKLNPIEIKNDFYTLSQLTKRNTLVFLKDKAGVFFSLLAPLIILLLYILFLGDLQVSSVISFFPQEMQPDEKAVKAYVDSWMIAGVLSVACITVSLGANTVIVQDRTGGILNDGLSSPVKKRLITLSYFLFNFFVTSAIVFIVYLVCLAYLAIGGGWYLTAADIFSIFGLILFSSLSSTLITTFICYFIKTMPQLGAFQGIASAVLGFFIGAYMPMSLMPKAAQYISALIPGSHSAAMFRQILMRGALENLGKNLPAEAVKSIAESFVMEVDFFGVKMNAGMMALYLAASTLLFLSLILIFSFKKKKK